jgi:hypothetical protein
MSLRDFQLDFSESALVRMSSHIYDHILEFAIWVATVYGSAGERAIMLSETLDWFVIHC